MHTIVGINDSHDASACVVRDGKLLVAIAEERLQRIKGMAGFPARAIEACLQTAGLTLRDVDYVAFGNCGVSPSNLHNYFASVTIHDLIKVQEEYWYPIIYQDRDVKLSEVLPEFRSKGMLAYPMEEIPFSENREISAAKQNRIQQIRHQFAAEWFALDEDRIRFIDHHTAHACYGYLTNPKRESGADILALTSDAGGDGAYESVRTYSGGRPHLFHQGRTNVMASLYSYVTLLLGMRYNEHEYKVMGLAPYAPEYQKEGPRQVFLDAVEVDRLEFRRNPQVHDLFAYFRDRLKGFRFDGIAGGLQDFLEERLAEWVRNAIDETGVRDISFTGGLALNIKANKRLCEMDEVGSLFVSPGAGDESLPIGAAFTLLDELGSGDGSPVRQAPGFYSAYLGSSTNDEEIEDLVNHPQIQANFDVNRNSGPDDVARIIHAGEICAVFSGSMEFGPRALGHRSLIADPSNPESVKKINNAIKMRDFWMPFTPSILSERMDDYIVNPKNLSCDFMTLAFDTTDLGREHLAAAIHPADRTARPQRVRRDISPDYYDIIKAFEKLTGVGAVLNTSLNIHGKPIVMKPVEIAEEILIAHGVELNNIYIEGTLFRKRP